MTRICLIGLPRCGSQYISNVIAKSMGPGMENLAEPFSAGHPYCIDKDDNGLLHAIPSDFTKYNSHTEQIDYVLNFLKNGNQEQSLVLKLFLTDDIILFLSKILNILRALNFKFLIIKRENIEYHLISYAASISTNKWHSRHGNGIQTRPIHISIERYPDILWLYNIISNFDTVIIEHKLDTSGLIRYEHAIDDLTNYFSIPINTDIDLKKQLPSNPYDMIENAKEVKDYIQTFMSTHAI